MRFIFNTMMKKICLLILLSGIAYGQSLNTLTGYFNIPSGEIGKDRSVVVGTSFLNKIFYDKIGFNENSLTIYASIVYLPLVEFSFRFTKRLEPPYPEALGDRMISIKFNLLKESKIIPSISLGAHDFTRSKEELTNRFNALYIAATKNIAVNKFIDNISLTYGYGFDFITALKHHYVGHFGGAEIRFARHYYIISEYDGRFVNGAFKANLFNHINLLFGFIGLKYPCGGASVSFSL